MHSSAYYEAFPSGVETAIVNVSIPVTRSKDRARSIKTKIQARWLMIGRSPKTSAYSFSMHRQLSLFRHAAILTLIFAGTIPALKTGTNSA
jgi:hypothetical protein